MRYIADLHIHSPYSRATSKSSHLHGLAAWAAIKGIDVVGTGDFTHPGWLAHLQEHLVEAEPGFFRLRDTSKQLYHDVVPPGLVPDISQIRFTLTSEISSIYKRGGKVRKIHNILFAPDLDSVKRMNVALSAIGNLESDGRPILGLDSRNLLEILLENAPEGFLVPAHIWTPWFSLFGSKSGFDHIEDCFGDLTSHIFALETGLSSDPDMNRTISALDGYSLISNSDCHSPGKLGREANIFTTGLDYFSMREALRHPVDDAGEQRFTATIEFYPEEGKYHCDGHRKCQVCLEPHETREKNGICPKCGRPLTVGVLYRVMELADREKPVYPEGSPTVFSLVPLTELLSELLQVGPASKKVMMTYANLIHQFGSEFAILLDRDIDEIEHKTSSHLAEAVQRVRTGKVIRKPGYDGEFGVIRVFTESERKGFGGQMNLFGTSEEKPVKKRRRSTKKPFAQKPIKKKEKVVNKELNPEQLAVVESNARHIIVKAGPGTGKTHTLVQRLIRQTENSDSPCTVITFTNKAANELQDRLKNLSGENDAIHVSTMHGYCLKWLRQKNPETRVAGPDIRKWFLRLLKKQNGNLNIQDLDEDITDFLQQAPNLCEPLPEKLKSYFSLLEKDNFIDIDAVVPSLAAILYEGNQTAEAIRCETGSLYIDEFQDLNESQYEVIRLLAETSSVFAIGDPDQAIYGFRGSSPSWFYRFMEDLQPQRFSLHRNYRSCSTIVQAANQLISNNPHPALQVQNESYVDVRGDILMHKASSAGQEAGFIVKQIEKLIGGTTHREIDRIDKPRNGIDITLNDIAILYRTTRQADIIASALMDHGFPIQVVDIRPYYLLKPVKPLFNWILIATGHGDTTHLLSLLKQESGIGASLLRQIEMCVPQVSDDVLTSFAGQKENFDRKLVNKIEKMLSLREKVLQIAAENGVPAVLKMLAEQYGIKDDEPDLVRFIRLADNFDVSIDAFAKHLLLHNDSVVYDKRGECVTLMTMHASKGLEFKVVFMVGLEEGVLPIAFRGGESGLTEGEHVEEERRLFYVGMTRAEELLYLSHVQNRKIGGQDIPQDKSRFLNELPDDLIRPVAGKVRRRSTKKKIKQLGLFDKL